MAKVKGDDIGGKSKHELLMECVNGLEEKTPLENIAKVVGISSQKIEKAIAVFIKRGKISGSIDGEFYIPSA